MAYLLPIYNFPNCQWTIVEIVVDYYENLLKMRVAMDFCTCYHFRFWYASFGSSSIDL
jgi:hypothetical protein